SGVVYSNSVSINWAYTDPQASPQSTYHVVVFRTSDTQISGFNINDPSNYAPVISGTMNGGQTWGTAGVTAVYDSGDITSTATTAVIPTGHLYGATEYRVFVFVTNGAAG